jgi:hypothetical protein
MDVFDLDRALVSEYERFARSFTQIRADDIRSQIKEIYASNEKSATWPTKPSLLGLYSFGSIAILTGRKHDGPFNP